MCSLIGEVFAGVGEAAREHSSGGRTAPADWDPRYDDRFEAGNATDRRPQDETPSQQTSRHSASRAKTSSGHRPSCSQDARELGTRRLTSRDAAGNEETPTSKQHDRGSAARQSDSEHRIASTRVRPVGQDRQPYTLLLDFRARAVSYFTREFEKRHMSECWPEARFHQRGQRSSVQIGPRSC